MLDQLKASNVRGRVRASYLTENCNLAAPLGDFKPNLIVNEWATIVAKLLTAGDARYRIAGMYLEFENVANPGDPVAVDPLTRQRNVDYYNALAGSSDRDYLRVSLTANQLLSEGEGLRDNQILFFARSQGLQGVHGKPFSAADRSVVFGASLVAFVDATDATRDLICSSFYFDIGSQVPKLSTSQIGLEWELTLN